MADETRIEWGVQYPDGTVSWTVSRGFGTLDSPEARRSFQEQHNLKLAAMGAPPQTVSFIRRETQVLSEIMVVPGEEVPVEEPPAEEPPAEEPPAEEPPAEELPAEEPPIS